MSHPDEGTIQMLLDGELGPDEQARLEAHASSCAACAARIEEARAYQLEADRLVGVLAVPLAAATRPAARRHGRAWRAVAWAASVVLAVGLGYFGRGGAPTRPNDSAVGNQTAETASPRTGQAAAPQGTRVPSTPVPVPAAGQHPADAPVTKGTSVADERQRSAPETKRPPSATPPPPAAAGGALREDGASRDAAIPMANALQAKSAAEADVPEAQAAAERNEPVMGWRVIALEEAVRILGGQLRLIDGLDPDRVETGPGTAVAGADPTAAVVRVIYASGTIMLDEQRMGVMVSGGRFEAARPQRAAAAPALGWREVGGIRFAVTGSVSPDSLREIAARVR